MIINPFSLNKPDNNVKHKKFDDMTWDEKVDLCEKNPELYSIVAEEKLNDFINTIADENKRLEMQRLQFRINSQLRKYKDPIARYNKMVSLFWKQVTEFIDATKKV